PVYPGGRKKRSGVVSPYPYPKGHPTPFSLLSPFFSGPTVCRWHRLVLAVRSRDRCPARRCDAAEHAEHGEVPRIRGQQGREAGLLVGGGEERVQQSLPTQRELPQPGQELPHGGVVGEHPHHVARRPPLLGKA